MNLISLKCPHCGGNLDVREDMETFYCQFCGAKLETDHTNKSEMKIREMKIREMKHAERMGTKDLISDCMTVVVIIAFLIVTLLVILLKK